MSKKSKHFKNFVFLSFINAFPEFFHNNKIIADES